MPPFDPRAYEDAVVKPLRRRSVRDLPDELVSRYAVDLGMSDAEIVARLAEVRSHWNKSAASTGKAASVKAIYKAFLAEDLALRGEHGDRMHTVAWWRARAAERAGARQGEVDALAATLRAHFGVLGLVAAGQLAATMRATSSSLAPDEVDQALAAANVRREVPVELPKASGLQDTVYRTLRARLGDARVGSVVELLHGPPTGMRLLRPDRVVPVHGLTPAAVADAVERANRRSGEQAAREALGILNTAARAGVDLRALALFHLLEDVRQARADGVPDGVLVQRLRASGLADDEARLAVFSVLNETVRAPVGGLAGVTELLASGKLIAARQALVTVSDATDAAAARAAVDQQAEQVRQLRALAQDALAAGDEGAAAHHLRQAVALAGDDDELAAQVLRVPLPPVAEVSARVDGLGARVSWRAPATHPDDTVYRVVRQAGRAPGDPDDGSVVREAAGGSVCVDAKAPAGAVGYAVFARVEGGAWSKAATTTVDLLPAAHDIQLSSVDGKVDAQWQVHPDAVAVEVRRDGADNPVRLGGKTSFVDRPGSGDHVYTFAVAYRGADGALLWSAKTSARAGNRGRARAVSALRITAVPSDAGARVAITWRHTEGVEVTVRRADRPAPWAFGAVVTAAAVDGHGEPVRGAVADRGEWRTLTADVPVGRFFYVPFTHGPAGMIRGHEDVLGVAPPVADLRCERLGPDVVVSWTWPANTGTADVRWTGGFRRITRHEYQSEGGCRVHCGTGAVTIAVSGVVPTPGGDSVSAPVELTLGARPPAVAYTVSLARRPLVGGGTVRVRLTADQEIPDCTVLVVAAPGLVMPLRADQGQVLLRQTQDLPAGDPVDLVADLPKLRKPFWVRCFLDEGAAARLVDPPTRQMKVS
ncbi:fibronectin type III domain-containing protein [Actinokineospora iranica]|uniref:SaeA first Fn3-like domain-containing protein n=1 Tax=Actinokineospora iranica TaxID=1271860 RepID=A0A1G6QCN8_9PSEU|nr:hypothetical protein [Actinokineospora iranica]SDC89435.1 hypothetical protein SAMN05216174_105183 [Actinokineospora iranica]